jgi:hypothetical protein
VLQKNELKSTRRLNLLRINAAEGSRFSGSPHCHAHVPGCLGSCRDAIAEQASYKPGHTIRHTALATVSWSVLRTFASGYCLPS